jgi:hypothetical protein
LQRNLNLFDLLLNETSPWETLHDEHKAAAIEVLARILTNTTARNQDEEKNHE